jgi:hypothetical protein
MNIDKIIHNIAEGINKKRREEVIRIYSSDNSFWKSIREAKTFDTYTKGNKSKSMRKIASIPDEVDVWFSRIYGPDYYKDKDFFVKVAPEWSVIDRSKL